MKDKKKVSARKKDSGRISSKTDDRIVLNMTFEEAMKKALNTPLPQNKKK